MDSLIFKLEKETFKKYHQSFFIIDQKIYEINNKKFRVKNSLSNLSFYLNSIGSSLINLFGKSIEHKCKECSKDTKITFYRNKLRVYHFCSVICQRNYKNKNRVLVCSMCMKKYKQKNRIYNTCGDNSCIEKKKKIRNKNISKNHWINSEAKDFIMNKRIETRRKNDRKLNRKYHAWNKGKTGIFSKESIEKIRNAAINQLKNQKIKKTGIEKKIENFLIEANIDYIYSYILKKRQYDFYIKNENILIEADGDYWHGNPAKYNFLTDHQILKQKDDKIKDRIAKEEGFKILRFWEFDIYHNFEKIKNKIISEING